MRLFWSHLIDMLLQVFQLMILVGPLGQGSFALQILGSNVQRGSFATYNTSSFIGPSGASTIATCSQLLGLMTWGYGTFFWLFATIGILHYMISDPRELLKWDQTLSAWSMVFPFVSRPLSRQDQTRTHSGLRAYPRLTVYGRAELVSTRPR